ncbi:biopolymer transport protein ExbB/TolQ [Haloferula luteola]|uniref:Biopolymer transport protein ExbB/TolQ n=1 Tax=Haloferula luteola TaxID=595692 RepID=A0A840VBU4_9BACT|nr:hypothetical protein [Haloferula luteola]MBB5350351.1 biopolymer transport protein ExbB/TolQ [Haloferula luteola]
MENFTDILKQPFVWGLALGLILAFFAWKSGISTKIRLSRDIRRLENELRELQGHLNTQLKINAQGNQSLQDELKTLKEQNENLRISNATLQSKPGRAEVKQYQIMEAAVRQMREQAPGFAPAWEKALRDAESEFEAGENGLRRLVRKVMPAIGYQAGNGGAGDDKDDPN